MPYTYTQHRQLGQLRNVAWQRAKAVVEEKESLAIGQEEQIGRHLRQSHVCQLKLQTVELSAARIKHLRSQRHQHCSAGLVSRRCLLSSGNEESTHPLCQQESTAHSRVHLWTHSIFVLFHCIATTDGGASYVFSPLSIVRIVSADPLAAENAGAGA